MKRHIAAVLLAILAALYLPVAALAAPADGTCSLTIDFHTSDSPASPIPGAAFRIYRAAEEDGDGYKWTEGFEDCDEDVQALARWKIDELIELAKELSAYVTDEALTADAEGTTNSNGLLKFEGLEPGVYLVMGEAVKVGDVTYTPAPFLVVLPGFDKGELLTDVTAVPKYTQTRPEPTPGPELGPEQVQISVVKVWQDEGYDGRPLEITVQLLMDGEVYDEQVLNQENNWRHTWDDLPTGHRWQIVEKDVPDGYTVRVELRGSIFTVTNIYTPDVTPSPEPSPTPTPSPAPSPTPVPTPTPPVPDEPKLPQTGQMWWPVPVLLAAGIVLFAAGLLLVRQEEGPDESKK